MFKETLETFLNSLAYFFWPFVFVMIVGYYLSKLIVISGGSKKKSVEKKKRDRDEKEEMTHLADKALLFKPPKIETSFGDQRIGDVHSHEKKD